MYLTDEKRLSLKLNGSFYTRKWNEFVDYVYFEKILGGKSLLKSINKKSQELNLSYNSSMISEVEAKRSLEAGWIQNHSLLICESNLKDIKQLNQSDSKPIEHTRFNLSDIETLLKVDGKIFSSYWKNSYSNFVETMKSCNNNHLFKIFSDNELRGDAILGETRGFTYLQRFGIDKDFHKQGMGENLLKYILSFAKSKN